jgi:serine/threonine protein kinase
MSPAHQYEVDNELRAAKKLCLGTECDNIVKVLNSGQLQGSLYTFIDMELCDFNLEDYIEGGGLLKLGIRGRHQKCLAIIRDLADGLTYIHWKGEIHRDLKPKNGTCMS